MKTLLLTLVVVTILCLDLGYTRECCYSESSPKTSKGCPAGENVCFVKTLVAPVGPTGKKVLERGCAATCPKGMFGVNINCCTKDKCNCGYIH
uniref:Three-finger toxin n=1 Tax=Calliophis bivirgatus TaxID=8633 RepID=A0A898IN20_CALBG|nr:three-finger toxin [Calliophis bivirgatus]